MHHFAAAFEDHTLVDAETGSLDIPSKNRWFSDFDPLSCVNVSDQLAADDHDAGFNIGSDLGLFADDQRIRCIDLAAKRAVDPNRPMKAELALKLTAPLDHAGDLKASGRNA